MNAEETTDVAVDDVARELKAVARREHEAAARIRHAWPEIADLLEADAARRLLILANLTPPG